MEMVGKSSFPGIVLCNSQIAAVEQGIGRDAQAEEGANYKHQKTVKC